MVPHEILIRFDRSGNVQGAHQKNRDDSGKIGKPVSIEIDTIPGLIDLSAAVAARDEALAKVDVLQAYVDDLESQLDATVKGSGTRRHLTPAAWIRRYTPVEQLALTQFLSKLDPNADDPIFVAVKRGADETDRKMRENEMVDLSSPLMSLGLDAQIAVGIIDAERKEELLKDSTAPERQF